MSGPRTRRQIPVLGHDAPRSSPVIAGVVTGLTVTHHTASVDAIEAATIEDPVAAMQRLLDRELVSECFALQTCNRVEWYVVTPTPADGRAVMAEEFSAFPMEHADWLAHEASLEHLLRVGAGLESMILGEDEILGQLRQARADAERADALGYLLAEIVQKGIRCGERARTETLINDGVLSIGRAAGNMAGELFDLPQSTALVVGAGEMARRAAHALADADVDRLLIANRTVSHAEHLVEGVQGGAAAIGLHRIEHAMADADVVITATGSMSPLLDANSFAAAGETTVIDIGQPRDVDPRVDDLKYVDRYDLEEITARTRTRRTREATEVEAIVERELERLHAQFKRKQADDVIAAMYEGADAIKRRELRTARTKLADGEGLEPGDAEVLHDLVDAVIGQLLAAPTKSLREAAEEDDWETIQTALQLFDPEFPDGSVKRSDATASAGDEASEES